MDSDSNTNFSDLDLSFIEIDEAELNLRLAELGIYNPDETKEQKLARLRESRSVYYNNEKISGVRSIIKSASLGVVKLTGQNLKFSWIGSALVGSLEIGYSFKRYYHGEISGNEFFSLAGKSTVTTIATCGVGYGAFLTGAAIAASTSNPFGWGIAAGFLASFAVNIAIEKFWDWAFGKEMKVATKSANLIYQECLELYCFKTDGSDLDCNLLRSRRKRHIKMFHPDQVADDPVLQNNNAEKLKRYLDAYEMIKAINNWS